MKRYDPNKQIDPAEWLAIDEYERTDLVEDYHREIHEELERLSLHAAVHVVVENQLATDEQHVRETLARLQRQGLSRHEAIHAIGSVLADHIYNLMNEQSPTPNGHRRYFSRLRRLTAKRWLKGKI